MSAPDITETGYLGDGPLRFAADAIRSAALDGARSPLGSGTSVIDCGGRARSLLAGLLRTQVDAVRAADVEYRRVCDARLNADSAYRAKEQARTDLANAFLDAAS